ncbi:MAG: exonuclease SbcCD subunit D [Lachnospiraceae bacterium]|nr:exonuclease SbcCD subunit D [Lachnospiraceae bacterium]
MKLLHLSDLHLGRSLKDYDLIRDQAYFLDTVIETVHANAIDAVLLAGDIYDRAVPSEAAVNLLDSFFERLVESGTETFVISGNHDSDDRLHFGSSLFEERHIHIAAKFNGELKEYTLQDDFGPVHLYLLPFVKASQVRHFYPDEEIATYEDAVRCILRHADIDFSERNVIVSHQFVAGSAGDPEKGGSEGLSVQSVGLVERISAACFDGFDYAALGHIHAPQQVGRKEVRYAGSPLKYSLSEAGHNKTMPFITLQEKGDVSVELLPVTPLRDLRHIKGTLKELLDGSSISGEEDFIYATLTEEYPGTDLMGTFRQYYPNTVAIDYEQKRKTAAADENTGEAAETRTFSEIICDFYRKMYGEEISEEELALMKETAREAGVYHEAD